VAIGSAAGCGFLFDIVVLTNQNTVVQMKIKPKS
jgi:hypothetical protein